MQGREATRPVDLMFAGENNVDEFETEADYFTCLENRS